MLSAKGRLRRCFPGPSFSIDKRRIQDSGFRGPLTDFLVKADVETLKEAVPTTKKAGSKVAEVRDTIHPKLITEMLTGILRAVGEVVSIPRIHKNTRDDVLLKDARSPWRRSPFWLLLRVALQTTLWRSDQSHLHYKCFMIFFMSHVLDAALIASLTSDLLFQMKAKIMRRLLKLDLKHETRWFRYTQDVLHETERKIKFRWNAIETNSDPDGAQRIWASRSESMQLATKLSLCTLQPYLDKVVSRDVSMLDLSSSLPPWSKRLVQSSLKLPNTAIISGADETTLTTWLVDVEAWVPQFLDQWTKSQLNFQQACLALAKLIAVYKDTATMHYDYEPQDFSLMVLTLTELWIALDVLAIRDCPLLRDYRPGFPAQLFEPLLLPEKSQMKRLLSIERYIAGRNSVPDAPCLFRSVGEQRSFSVRYFDQSPRHQALYDSINEDAEEKRSQKILELSRQKSRHDALMKQSNDASCEYEEVWRRRRMETQHKPLCKRCRLKNQAAGMTIDVHEWPLPKSNVAAKSVVFELDVPYVFSAWRNTTFALLIDVFSPISALANLRRNKKKFPLYVLQDYDGLKAFVKSEKGRLQLASSTKPFTVAHYRSQKVSGASQQDVCVNSGLQYEIFDSKNTRMIKDLSMCFNIRDYCTLKLPAGPFMNLEFAVKNTTHSSNEVIAAQRHCDNSLSLHEYYSFGTLRSGYRLQWYNIARELVSHTLDFNREETFILLLQASLQAGPPSGEVVSRGSHVYLEDERFGADLLLALEDTLVKYQRNWQGIVAVRAVVTLATRLLSLSPHSEICIKVVDYLRTVRDITLSWIRTLKRGLHECYEDNRRNQLSDKLLETALSCHGTFDVGKNHIHKLLYSVKDVAELTECMILIHDHMPAVLGNFAKRLRPLLRRSRRISILVEPLLRRLILECGDGLDITIESFWQGYRPGTVWAIIGSPDGPWLKTITKGEPGCPLTTLHYNLLSGSLLVNGSPLTRLPREYEAHPTYVRLLGKVMTQSELMARRHELTNL